MKAMENAQAIVDEVEANLQPSILLAAAVVAIGVKVVWELVLSPLARQRIPGPKLAAVSNAWFEWVTLRFRRTASVHELFKQYGPVVRVGSNRVVFNEAAVVKELYRTHKFRKTPFYENFTFGGVQNSFSTSDPLLHAKFRRWNSPAFRGESMRSAGRVLIGEIDDIVQRIRKDCSDGQYMDTVAFFPIVTLNVLGRAVLGENFNQMETGVEHRYAKLSNYWLIDKVMMAKLPRTFLKALRYSPFALLRNVFKADDLLTEYSTGLFDAADTTKSLDERPDMLTAYKAFRDSKTGETAPLDLAVSDLGLFMIAGMETTGTSFVYLIYELASKPKLWDNLRAELATVDYSDEWFSETLRDLKYLNALIREVLRIHSPVSALLERIVPPGGAELGNYWLPAGTLVGGQAYSAHRDQELFPDPELVNPERWVRRDSENGRWVDREVVTPEMHAAWFPFGQGARQCTGKPLAELELQLVTAALVNNFRVHLHESATPESMKSIEIGAMRPQSGRCLVNFEYTPSPALEARCAA
ncbi:cytochrome P450 [Exidia glandulosa HHB12029]|uniref:Cytochrome P450 n=1 Tax=Exidia glandulosa HHB12029 TaxID=1314781 RepID=A0A165ZZW7_EXIGL|nr:cytochrome P450 [Exidia glandulosa HHB12029]